MKDDRLLVRVQGIERREGFKVNIRFTDGSSREVDLAPYLRGPIFEPIRNDPVLFGSMQVEEGTIAWPNGADIDPDVLYYGLTPAWADNADISNSDSQLL